VCKNAACKGGIGGWEKARLFFNKGAGEEEWDPNIDRLGGGGDAGKVRWKKRRQLERCGKK